MHCLCKYLCGPVAVSAHVYGDQRTIYESLLAPSVGSQTGTQAFSANAFTGCIISLALVTFFFPAITITTLSTTTESENATTRVAALVPLYSNRLPLFKRSSRSGGPRVVTFLFTYFLCMCASVWMSTCHDVHMMIRGQLVWISSLFTTQVLGIELRLPDLAAGSFIQWAIWWAYEH